METLDQRLEALNQEINGLFSGKVTFPQDLTQEKLDQKALEISYLRQKIDEFSLLMSQKSQETNYQLLQKINNENK